MSIIEVTRARQEAVKELIKKYPIENQGRLVELLQQEYGIETNQTAISRDLRQLGVVKAKGKEGMVYELREATISQEILTLGVLDVSRNEIMIVIKTLAGLAPFVGDYLDQHHEGAILATLAGENVVFVIPQSIKKIEETYQVVCKIVYFKQVV